MTVLHLWQVQLHDLIEGKGDLYKCAIPCLALDVAISLYLLKSDGWVEWWMWLFSTLSHDCICLKIWPQNANASVNVHRPISTKADEAFQSSDYVSVVHLSGE